MRSWAEDEARTAEGRAEATMQGPGSERKNTPRSAACLNTRMRKLSLLTSKSSKRGGGGMDSLYLFSFRPRDYAIVQELKGFLPDSTCLSGRSMYSCRACLSFIFILTTSDLC